MKNDLVISLLLSKLHHAVYTTLVYANILRLTSFRSSSSNMCVLWTTQSFGLITGLEWIIILSFKGFVILLRGISAYCVFKEGSLHWGKEGAAVRQLEVSACRSGSGLTFRRACPCPSAEIQRNLKTLIVSLSCFQADTHQERGYMDGHRNIAFEINLSAGARNFWI